jgi:hypothetical protein
MQNLLNPLSACILPAQAVFSGQDKNEVYCAINSSIQRYRILIKEER